MLAYFGGEERNQEMLIMSRRMHGEKGSREVIEEQTYLDRKWLEINQRSNAQSELMVKKNVKTKECAESRERVPQKRAAAHVPCK